jgi:mannose-6-phosphate isomerase-like protein (cupin superfamily)
MEQTREATSAASRVAFVVTSGGDRLNGALQVFGDEVRVKISSRDTGGAFTVIEEVTQPMGGPPLHVHHEQDEWFHILEGEYLFEVDGSQMHAGPGDIVFAPRGSRHTFEVIGSSAGRSMITVVPGGLDLFFEEVLAVCPPGSAPDVQKILPLFGKYRMELLGPPLAERAQRVA